MKSISAQTALQVLNLSSLKNIPKFKQFIENMIDFLTQVGDLLGIGNLDNYDENHFMFYVLKTDVKQEASKLIYFLFKCNYF